MVSAGELCYQSILKPDQSVTGCNYSSNGICTGAVISLHSGQVQSQSLGVVTAVMVAAGEPCCQSTLRPRPISITGYSCSCRRYLLGNHYIISLHLGHNQSQLPVLHAVATGICVTLPGIESQSLNHWYLRGPRPWAMQRKMA